MGFICDHINTSAQDDLKEVQTLAKELCELYKEYNADQYVKAEHLDEVRTVAQTINAHITLIYVDYRGLLEDKGIDIDRVSLPYVNGQTLPFQKWLDQMSELISTWQGKIMMLSLYSK